MSYRNRFRVLKLVGVIVFLAATGARMEAVTIGSNMNIKTNVAEEVKCQVVSEATSFIITRADDRNGFVDVANGTVLAIVSNIQSSFMLTVNWVPSGPTPPAPDDQVSSVQITPSTGGVYVMPVGGSVNIQVPYTGQSQMNVSLNYRFLLKPRARSGTYDWPIGNYTCSW